MAVSRQTLDTAKGLAFPIAASVVAGAATMFVPTAMLEAFTGATGLSEIFPATAAPLGDTARALIAFSTGALTMAVTAIVANRKGPKSMAAPLTKPVYSDAAPVESTSLVTKLKDRFAELRNTGLNMPPMPWKKAAKPGTVVRELGDLPKLRSADSHPDAAPRRPFSAELDLGVVATEMAMPVEAPPPVPTARFWNDEAVVPAPVAEHGPATVHSEPVIAPEAEPVIAVGPAPVAAPQAPAPQAAAPATDAVATDSVAAPSPASLADMVAQLEQAVLQRQAILNRVAEAQNHLAEMPVVAESVVDVEPAVTAPFGFAEPAAPAIISDGYVPPYFDRPPLEAVPTAAKPAEVEAEEDDALRAALATLRRMNSQAG